MSSLLMEASFPYQLCSALPSVSPLLLPLHYRALCKLGLCTQDATGDSSLLCIPCYLLKSYDLTLPLSFQSRTIAIARSPFLYSFTAAFIFVTLYSSSIDRRPLPPFSLGMYRMAVEPLWCLQPISTTILRASLSNYLSSVIDHCCVHIR